MDQSLSDPSLNGAAGGILAALAGVLLFVVVIALLINVVLSYFIWAAYKVVPTEHQKLPAGLVWLCAVPCIGSIMLIVCSVMVPQAFQAAFAAKGRNDQGDCGFVLGLIGSIGTVVGAAVPVIGPLVSLGCFVVLIVFIVKLQSCKKAMQMS
jgi:hypothetical protein